MSKQAVLFSLVGGGDRMVFLASPQALKWCQGLEAGEQSVPEDVMNSLKPFLEDDFDPTLVEGEVWVQALSADNDGAIHLATLCRMFDSEEQAIGFAKDKGLALSKQRYDGCIY